MPIVRGRLRSPKTPKCYFFLHAQKEVAKKKGTLRILPLNHSTSLRFRGRLFESRKSGPAELAPHNMWGSDSPRPFKTDFLSQKDLKFLRVI